MKNAKWMLPVTLMLLTGLMAAQSLTSSTVMAQVPFDFVVGNKIIPAGEVAVASANLDGRILAIRNFDARKSALTAWSTAGSGAMASSTKLVFKRYGNQYFLSSISLENSAVIYQMPESKAEAELRAQNAPSSPVTLLASLK